MSVEYTIKSDDLEWEMDWSGTNPDGSRRYPNKPDKEIMFEPEKALALLLLNEVIHTNDHWWEKEWPEDARKSWYLGVNCSDIFSWGTAESEEIYHEEIESLYREYVKDPSWGPAIWCIKKRKEMPQGPVAKSMIESGIDLESIRSEFGIRDNYYDCFCKIESKLKYESYVRAAINNGLDVIPREDQSWWKDWAMYRKAGALPELDYKAIGEQVKSEIGFKE